MPKRGKGPVVDYCRLLIAALSVPFALYTAAPAAAAMQAPAACIQISTPADLDNVRNDLAGQYCLAADIDMSGVADFAPIGGVTTTGTSNFQGTFNGQGHFIRNLSIASSSQFVGLFGSLAGTIQDLTLQNVKISGSDPNLRAGTLLGVNSGGTVSDVHASGDVHANCDFCTAGGLIGENSGTVMRSSAAVTVTLGAFGAAGGLIGSHDGGVISQSYATGAVALTPDVNGSTSGQAGGLTGLIGNASIIDSFATGLVSAPGEPLHGSNFVGGLVGDSAGGKITRSFAVGPVSTGAAQSSAGGLIGRSQATALREVYAVGAVFSTSGGPSGGLVGDNHFSQDSLSAGYWDTQTSGFPTSGEGVGRSTRSLQAGLPHGFTATRWAITPDVSFPYLTAAGLDFAAPLAITVKNNVLYTFVPISQRDLSQYLASVAHSDDASLATAYAIIARAIGVADGVGSLQDVAIDRYFWDDSRQKARWRGPVTQHASLGPLTAIAATTAIGDDNVIGPLRARDMVLLRGRYKQPGGGSGTQWMLATSFTTDADGNVDTVVADDPWTGLQVRIDPATKRVIAPAGFPLARFTVNAFERVTLD